MTPLARANLLLLALLVGHTLDHAVNQPGRDYSFAVSAIGPVGLAGAVIAVVLALRGRREAGPFSMLVGGGTLIGFTAVHLLPHWGTFSDPYSDIATNVGNWILVAVPMLVAATVFVLGLRETRAGEVAPVHPAR